MSRIYSLGVMTGTSCDGVDLALLAFDPDAADEKLWHTASERLPQSLRTRLLVAQRGELKIPQTALLTRDYSRWVGRACKKFLAKWKVPINSTLIAVHGQTVWHAPEENFSVQLLDAAIIAALTECTVTGAFRQPDLACGGEGAPLVPYYHWMRALSLPRFQARLPVAIHNVGGMANLTYITKSRSGLIAFDSGPGNALIDIAAERATRGRMRFDKDGKLAAARIHTIDWPSIEKAAQHRFFKRKPPKSTGKELFGAEFLKHLPGRGVDLVASATAFTAHTMARAYSDFVLKKGRRLHCVYIAGGGARNPTLLRLFSRELTRLSGEKIRVEALPLEFAPTQYLEAMAFARLGIEALQGNATSLGSITGAKTDALGAGIFPSKNYKRLLKIMNMA
jgi:anhydro-N-acetylmuramic acid kinase